MNSAAQMSEEHRKVVRQFTAFKERTIDHLNRMEYWHTRMVKAETYVSARNPVVEATYAMNDAFQGEDEKRALGLYNCLVPKVQAHSFRMGNYFNSYSQKNILKEMQVERLINLDIAVDDKQYNPQVLKHKNRVLKYQLSALKEELQVVEWYITTMEDGISAAEIMK